MKLKPSDACLLPILSSLHYPLTIKWHRHFNIMGQASLIPRLFPPPSRRAWGEAWYPLFAHVRISQVFRGFVNNEYLPYIRYIYEPCMFVLCKWAREWLLSQCNLLSAKALSCVISVVKANCVQDGAAMSHVWREINVSVANNGPFWFVTFLFGCKLQKDGIVTSEK